MIDKIYKIFDIHVHETFQKRFNKNWVIGSGDFKKFKKCLNLQNRIYSDEIPMADEKTLKWLRKRYKYDKRIEKRAIREMLSWWENYKLWMRIP